MKIYHIYKLAIKYWLSGDEWDEAVSYAKFIVNGFRK